MKRRPPRLGETLARLSTHYGREFLPTDPIQFPHRYGAAGDQEVVAFVAAALAYGSVPQIAQSVERALAALGAVHSSPAAAIDAWRIGEHRGLVEGFRHRFNDGRDLACLFSFLSQMRRRAGSIAGFFAEGRRPDDTLRESLASFSRRALALDAGALYGRELPRDAGVRFFFTSPLDGSACKRLCMFLRWVVRPNDGVDLGLWTCLAPRELVMPLDTHTTRICFANGLSPSPFATWRNAEHVTAALRRYDPADPVRFDFALSRLGILRVSDRRCGLRVRVPTRRR